MQELIDRIKNEGSHVGGGIVKVDSFINHQVDAGFMYRLGEVFARQFTAAGVGEISKVVTAEVSGIAPALATARALGVSMIYARKQRSAAMTDQYYMAPAVSRTKGSTVELRISKRYLSAADRVLLIDDFLATGSTLDALVRINAQSGATLCGIGCLIEKPGENGRVHFAKLDVPIVTLAKIIFDNDVLHVYG